MHRTTTRSILFSAVFLVSCSALLCSQQTGAPARFGNGVSAADVAASFTDQRIFIPVKVNGGQPSLFELDTTARNSAIDPGRAKELGLQIEAPAAMASAGTSLAAPASTVRDAVLGLPGVEVPLGSLAVSAQPDFSSVVGRNYEGTLGADFLSRVILEIDYGQQTARVYDPAAYHYSGHGVSVPFTLSGAAPAIHAKFSELSGKSGDGDFLVNTALDTSVVFANRFADAHKLFSSHVTSVQASDPEVDGGAAVSLARLDSFQVGSNTVMGTIAMFSRADQAAGGDPRLAGTIGGGMLRRFKVIFDYPHQQMIFEPGQQFRTDDEEDKSGMAIVANGPGLKRFEVTAVQPDTPAAKAGVQKGDVVAGIDNEAAADMTLDSVRKLFREPVRRYDVLMQRGDNTYDAMLQMHRRL
jgi:hypothetical protein